MLSAVSLRSLPNTSYTYEKFVLFRSVFVYIIKKYTAVAAESLLSLKTKKVSAHTFRRSKATHMLLSGVSLPLIQRFLRHESIQTTEEYLEIGSEAMIQAVNRTGTLVLPLEKVDEAENWREADVMEQIRLKISQR